jgi:hypothetical protein
MFDFLKVFWEGLVEFFTKGKERKQNEALLAEVKKLQLIVSALYAEQKNSKEASVIQNEILINLTTSQEMLVHSLEELKLIPSSDYSFEEEDSATSGWSNPDEDLDFLDEPEMPKDKKRLN